MAEYRILFDDDFLIEAFERYRKQCRNQYASVATKFILGALLLLLAALFAYLSNWWLVLFLAALFLLLFTAHHVDHCSIKRRFRKSPYRDDNVVISLSAEGFHGVGRESEISFTWPVFTKARSFRDGILLFQGPSLYNWLPDAALSNGSREEVESLITTHVKDYKVVEEYAESANSRSTARE